MLTRRKSLWMGGPGGLGSFRNHPGQCGVAAINPLFYTHGL